MNNDFHEYSAAFQDHQNDLAHFGIKGMKWKKRKIRNAASNVVEDAKAGIRSARREERRNKNSNLFSSDMSAADRVKYKGLNKVARKASKAANKATGHDKYLEEKEKMTNRNNKAKKVGKVLRYLHDPALADYQDYKEKKKKK